MKETVADLDARTAVLNAQTAQLQAKTARARQRQVRIGRWLRTKMWRVALATLPLIALVWASGFERWFALYPLSIGTATMVLLFAVTAWMEEGRLDRQSRTNLAVGTLVVLAGIGLSFLD